MRMSSKGRVVIPQDVRDVLKLEAGTRLQVWVQDGKIVLLPLTRSPIDALYGKHSGVDLLGDLEAEHRQEIDPDA